VTDDDEMENHPEKSRRRQLCFVGADERAMAAALREKFPDLRFAHFDPYDWFRRQGRELAGPSELDYPFIEDPSSSEEWRFTVARFPSGWVPEWSGPNLLGSYSIANEPRLSFVYEKSRWRKDGHGFESPRDGRVWAYYRADDAEHKAFLSAVWRVLTKIASNKFDWYDPQTLHFGGHVQKDGFIWIGHHAAAWCRGHHDRWLEGNLRPPGDWEAVRPVPTAWAFRGIAEISDRDFRVFEAHIAPPERVGSRRWSCMLTCNQTDEPKMTFTASGKRKACEAAVAFLNGFLAEREWRLKDVYEDREVAIPPPSAWPHPWAKANP
jgi:hypothetical protein